MPVNAIDLFFIVACALTVTLISEFLPSYTRHFIFIFSGLIVAYSVFVIEERVSDVEKVVKFVEDDLNAKRG